MPPTPENNTPQPENRDYKNMSANELMGKASIRTSENPNLKFLQDEKNRLREIKKAVEEKGGTPLSAAEILRRYRTDTSETKSFISVTLAKQAFEQAGMPDFILKPEAVKLVEEQGPVQFVGPRKRNPANKKEYEPDIYVKPIMETVGKGSKAKQVPTGELLIVVRTNNSTKADEAAVVTLVAKHTGGKLDVNTALVKTMSETEYSEICNKPEKELNVVDGAVRGVVTRERYFKRMESVGGYRKYWEREDARVSRGIFSEHEAQTREDFKSALEKRYDKVLETTDENIKKINKDITALRTAEKKRVEAAFKSPDYLLVLKQVENPKITKQEQDIYIAMIMKAHNLTKADIQKYVTDNKIKLAHSL